MMDEFDNKRIYIECVSVVQNCQTHFSNEIIYANYVLLDNIHMLIIQYNNIKNYKIINTNKQSFKHTHIKQNPNKDSIFNKLFYNNGID